MLAKNARKLRGSLHTQVSPACRRCAAGLDAAASRVARTANRLRRAALMSLLPLPKLGALASGQCQLQLRQTICARVTPSWRLTNYSASQKRRCAEYALGSGSLPIGKILRLSNEDRKSGV